MHTFTQHIHEHTHTLTFGQHILPKWFGCVHMDNGDIICGGCDRQQGVGPGNVMTTLTVLGLHTHTHKYKHRHPYTHTHTHHGHANFPALYFHYCRKETTVHVLLHWACVSYETTMSVGNWGSGAVIYDIWVGLYFLTFGPHIRAQSVSTVEKQ